MANGIHDTNTVKKIVGGRLKAARENVGYSRQEAVDKIATSSLAPVFEKHPTLGIDRYKKWEYGENPIEIEWLPAICEVYGCDAGYLFGAYECKNVTTQWICEETGLSEEAVTSIEQWHKHPHGDLGVMAFGYVVPIIEVINEIITSPMCFNLTNALSLYLIYAGILPTDAYEKEVKDISNEEHERFFSWASTNGRSVVKRTEIAEMHLQTAADTLKNMFRKILEENSSERDKSGTTQRKVTPR